MRKVLSGYNLEITRICAECTTGVVQKISAAV